MKHLLIEADTNDADYVTFFKKVSEEDLAAVLAVANAINQFKPYESGGHTHRHNFPLGECQRADMGEKSPEEIYVESGLCTQEQFDIFNELVPYGEYGIHTVSSVRVLEILSDKEVLNGR